MLYTKQIRRPTGYGGRRDLLLSRISSKSGGDACPHRSISQRATSAITFDIARRFAVEYGGITLVPNFSPSTCGRRATRLAESSRYFRTGKRYGGRGDGDEDARVARRMHGWWTTVKERGRKVGGVGEGEEGGESKTEKGKGEYEARVSGRVNNNARRQMSIPPPLFARSARHSLPLPDSACRAPRTSLCRCQEPTSYSNTRLGGPRSTWCGPTPIKHRCFVESPSTGLLVLPLLLPLPLAREFPLAPFVLPLDRSLTLPPFCFCLCMSVRSCPPHSSYIGASIMLQVRFYREDRNRGVGKQGFAERRHNRHQNYVDRGYGRSDTAQWDSDPGEGINLRW